jgi:acid-sensing ion channel, other
MTHEEVALKFRLLLHFQGTGNATEKEYKELDDVNELNQNENLFDYHLTLFQIMAMNNENVDYLLEKLSPKCEDILVRCKWKGSLHRCDGLFQQINSSEGHCCSFNNYAYPKWNYDPKMLSSIPKQPRRVTACGYQTGLTLLLKPFDHDYYGTEVAANGFRVSLN